MPTSRRVPPTCEEFYPVMKVTAAHLAELLQGKVEGDPTVSVTKAAPLDAAQAGDLAFVDNPKYEALAATTQASILLVGEAYECPPSLQATLLRVPDVRKSLMVLLEHFSHKNGTSPSISPQAYVHPQAKLGEGVTIGAYAVVEAGAVIGDYCTLYPQVYVGRNVHIGQGSTLHAGVRVLYDCLVGERCVLAANAVVGSDGFGYLPQPDKTWKKVPHVGNVILENDVEIGACTCIDRATLGSTVVRAGTKLDNMVHLAHNVEVGPNTVMAAQVGVAGSTKIGAHVQVGGQAGFAGHISIADGTRIQGQSGISGNIEEKNTALFGSPAIGYNDFVRSHIVFKHLPDIQRKLFALEKELAKLRAEMALAKAE